MIGATSKPVGSCDFGYSDPTASHTPPTIPSCIPSRSCWARLLPMHINRIMVSMAMVTAIADGAMGRSFVHRELVTCLNRSMGSGNSGEN